MKANIIIAAILAVVTFAATGCGAASNRGPAVPTDDMRRDGNKSEFGDNSLIIFYDSETGSSYLLDATRKFGAKIIYEYKNFNGIAITLPEGKGGKNINDSISYFSKVKGVISVERDRIYHLDDIVE